MKYLIFMQDEFDNNYYIGIYKDLSNAIPVINNWLSIYDVKIDELFIYSSTFGGNFDKEIEIGDNMFVMVRGFIITDDDLKTCD